VLKRTLEFEYGAGCNRPYRDQRPADHDLVLVVEQD
jgi:hypothetical protein